MKVTFLGTGTSLGVPIISCRCKVCTSIDPRDKRLRSSVLIEHKDKNFVIDVGPDFRHQMLRAKPNTIDAVLLTHEHKDHISGLDDIRPYNYLRKIPMDIYAESRVLDSVKQEYSYVFEENKYPGIPEMILHEISLAPFEIDGISIIPIRVMHMNLPVLAYRLENFAYITDASYISDEELEKIRGCDVIIINALRKEKHYSHFNLDETLGIICKLQPKKAYLTHIGHHMGLYEEVAHELPENVMLGYDGLKINV